MPRPASAVVTSKPARFVLALLRIAVGFIFLWSFLDKTFGLHYSTGPQILQLRAQWRGIARTPEQFGELAREIAACNSTRTGPKAYLAPLEDGTQYGLIAECNVVVMSGLTQAQLDNFFETSMSMIMGFFADLEVTLPGFVDWDPQGREVSL